MNDQIKDNNQSSITTQPKELTTSNEAGDKGQGISGTDEEKEIDKSEDGLLKLQSDPRFDEFLVLYNSHKIDNIANPIYKNGAQCVIKVYGLDPVRQYKYAKSLASRLLTKSNLLARKIIESKGIGYSEFIEVAAANMLKTENPSWWDRVGEVTQWKPKEAQQVVQQNNQFNVYALDSTEVKDFNKQFLDFLNKE